MRMREIILSVLMLIVVVEPGYASDDVDRKMLNLARDRGCMLCHDFQPKKSVGEQVLPMGPSWREIGKRYKGANNAEERLTQTVLQGTGPRPGDRHWTGKVTTDRMFPNTVEIKPEEARSLVHWILSLDK